MPNYELTVTEEVTRTYLVVYATDQEDARKKFLNGHGVPLAELSVENPDISSVRPYASLTRLHPRRRNQEEEDAAGEVARRMGSDDGRARLARRSRPQGTPTDSLHHRGRDLRNILVRSAQSCYT